MTKLQNMKCEKLLNKAIKYANDANRRMELAAKNPNVIERYILENTAHNHRGFAEGINYALVTIGFKHERLVELVGLITKE